MDTEVTCGKFCARMDGGRVRNAYVHGMGCTRSAIDCAGRGVRRMCVGKDETGDSETRTRKAMGDTERKHRKNEDWDTAQQCFREASQERESTRRKSRLHEGKRNPKQRDTAPIIQSQSRRAHADRAPSQQTDMQQSTNEAKRSRVKGSTSARVESSPWRGGIWGARFLATHILPNTSPASSEPGVMPGGLGVCAPAALYGVLVPLKFE